MSGPFAGVRVSVHTAWMRCGFTGSTAMDGSVWAFVVMSMFTRTFGEKLAPPVVDFEKYTSPSEPMAMDDWPPWYPGAWSTRTIAPKYGAAGPAAAGVAMTPRRATATRAIMIGRTNIALNPRAFGGRSMTRALLRSPPFA